MIAVILHVEMEKVRGRREKRNRRGQRYRRVYAA